MFQHAKRFHTLQSNVWVLMVVLFLGLSPTAHGMAADCALEPTGENCYGVKYKALLAEDELSETGWVLLFGGNGFTVDGEYQPHFVDLMIKGAWATIYDDPVCACGFPPVKEVRNNFTLQIGLSDYEDDRIQDNDIGAWSRDSELFPRMYSNIDSRDPNWPDKIMLEYQIDKGGTLEGREIEVSLVRKEATRLDQDKNYFMDPDLEGTQLCKPNSQDDILYRHWVATLKVPSLGIDASVDLYVNAAQGDKIIGSNALNFLWENYRRPVIESDKFKVIIFDPQIKTLSGEWVGVTRFLVDIRAPDDELPLNENGDLVGGFRKVNYKGKAAIEASFGYGYTDYVVDGNRNAYEPSNATKAVIDLNELPPSPSSCSVYPTSLDFGTVVVGASSSRTFTITNTGGGTLTGTVSESCSNFSVSPNSYSLSQGTSEAFTVMFTPSSTGTKSCTIDTGSPCSNISCSGSGGSQEETNSILFDESHDVFWTNRVSNGLSELSALLAEQGYTVQTLKQGPITYDRLKEHGVLVIGYSSQEFSSDEVDAIENYVADGGGLLLMGEAWSWEGSQQDFPLNQLASRFGYTINKDVIEGVTVSHGHPITDGVGSVRVVGASSISGYPADDCVAATAAVTSDGRAVIKVGQCKSGRFVFIGDSDMFTGLDYDQDGIPMIDENDNRQLALNTFSFLLKGGIPVEPLVPVEQALDANHNGKMDTEELLKAIEYWSTQNEVPGTGGQTISDEEMRELVLLWISGQPTTLTERQIIPLASDVYTPVLPSEHVALDAIQLYHELSAPIVKPGDLLEITFGVETSEDIAGLLLAEFLPLDWTLVPLRLSEAFFKETEHTWLWLSVPSAKHKNVRLKVLVPKDAKPGVYTITGVVMSAIPESHTELPPLRVEVVAPESIWSEPIRIFPNPARDTVTFKAQGAASLKVEIFTLNGEKIFEKQVVGETMEFPVCDQDGRPLANGVYLCLVTVKGQNGELLKQETRKMAILR